jgi:hypothetical protein
MSHIVFSATFNNAVKWWFYVASVINECIWNIGWMKMTRKADVRAKLAPVPLCQLQIPIWTTPGSEPALRSSTLIRIAFTGGVLWKQTAPIAYRRVREFFNRMSNKMLPKNDTDPCMHRRVSVYTHTMPFPCCSHAVPLPFPYNAVLLRR